MQRDKRVWRDGFDSLVEAALAHGAGRPRSEETGAVNTKKGQVIIVDFSFERNFLEVRRA